eukprot:TRINITY_DN74830_c0_g1_i2.p1 TRINITY_DN74830_c0_g1~~TRINITY_DN74830_c0_g1_i2.p1  ORF type:complete len:156 (+),score=24.00 TRINITY_DN74830_c0_g1_i2:44-469(+)
MKKILFLAAILSAVAGFSQTPVTLTVSAPGKAGFSEERLQRIDRLIQQYIDSNWISGAIALVARDGNIVYHKAIGYDDKSRNKPLQKDAIWRIASQTKAITSVGIMMLYEQGKLMLDDPISQIGRAVQQECRDRSRMPSSA